MIIYKKLAISKKEAFILLSNYVSDTDAYCMKKIVLLCLLIFLSLNSAYSQPFNLNKLNYWDNIITEKSNIKIPLASQYVDVSEKENEVCKQLIDSFESQSNRFVFGKIGHDWETADFVWHFYLPGRKFDPNSLEVIKLREIGFYDKIKDSVYTLSLKQKALNEIIKKAKEYRVTTEFEIPPTTAYVDYTNVEYSFGHSTVVYSLRAKP